ncbi:MAG: phycocyanobilin lyase [Oscillatoriales cyanobacterium CG2_30_44_21]|nr:MAG: phycocyanobilin lyase [Oscillatoriales cyanobacterium CG2_30_44_21]
MTDLAPLIQAVEEADSSKLLLGAVQNLASAQLEGAIPTLIETLSYNNPGAAVAAVEGLILLGSTSVPPLLELLDQHNYTARSWAIRALAGIGDPRGLVTLLGVATADFALSVRRAAVKGLGSIKWNWFPDELREVAQEEALEALLFVVQQDEEWVVRYAAVVGLEALMLPIANHNLLWRSAVQAQFNTMSDHDQVLAVRGRVWLAQQRLQQVLPTSPITQAIAEHHAPLTSSDWQDILAKLNEIKNNARDYAGEGGSRRFEKLAALSVKSAAK